MHVHTHAHTRTECMFTHIQDGWTALHNAAAFGDQAEVAKCLIKAGAKVEVPDEVRGGEGGTGCVGERGAGGARLCPDPGTPPGMPRPLCPDPGTPPGMPKPFCPDPGAPPGRPKPLCLDPVPLACRTGRRPSTSRPQSVAWRQPSCCWLQGRR